MGLEQVVPFANSRQYPSVPNVMDPLTPPADMLAFRKYTDLKYGTQKETTAKSTVAINVTMKPGVAGRMKPIGGFVEPWGVCFRTLESVLLRDRNIKRDIKMRKCAGLLRTFSQAVVKEVVGAVSGTTLPN